MAAMPSVAADADLLKLQVEQQKDAMKGLEANLEKFKACDVAAAVDGCCLTDGCRTWSWSRRHV